MRTIVRIASAPVLSRQLIIIFAVGNPSMPASFRQFVAIKPGTA
jgi:hypothetical protein